MCIPFRGPCVSTTHIRAHQIQHTSSESRDTSLADTTEVQNGRSAHEQASPKGHNNMFRRATEIRNPRCQGAAGDGTFMRPIAHPSKNCTHSYDGRCSHFLSSCHQIEGSQSRRSRSRRRLAQLCCCCCCCYPVAAAAVMLLPACQRCGPCRCASFAPRSRLSRPVSSRPSARAARSTERSSVRGPRR